MRFPLAVFAALALDFGHPAQADEVASSLRFIGGDICEKSLDGSFTEFDASEFRDWLRADGTAPARFCGCVAERYATEGDGELLSDIQSELIADETYFALNFTMFEHMTQCRAHFLEAGEVTDGDLATGEAGAEDLATDPEDIRLCQIALAGDMPLIAGSVVSAANAHLSKSGQSAADLCTCAAGYMAAQGQPLQDRIQNAANAQQAYGAALEGGVEICAGL